MRHVHPSFAVLCLSVASCSSPDVASEVPSTTASSFEDACASPDSGAPPVSPPAPRVDAGRPPGKDAGALADAAPPVSPAPDIPFWFTVDGAPAPIAGTATRGAPARITVGAYPTTSTGAVLYGPLPVDFEEAFSPTFCEQVRARALDAKGDSALAKYNRRWVRAGGGVPLDVPVSPFVGNDFVAVAAAAAAAAGASGVSPSLENPLQLQRVKLALAFEDDAVSSILGDTDGLAKAQQGYFAQQRATVVASGRFVTALAAKDVLCDLSTGRARFEIALEGTVAGAPYAGTSTATTLSPH